MKKMVRGAFAILALSGLSACVDDPIAPINGAPDRIQANPAVMWVKQGDSVAVLLRLVNEANNSTPTTFTMSNVGAGLAINLDTKYRPEYVNGSDTLIVPEVKSQQRYYVRGLTPGEWNYTVTSQGITGTFKVRVEPANLGAALSAATADAGDDVVITAPANTSFTTTATVTFATGQIAIASRAANKKSITVTLGPGVTGPATVAGVTLDYFPTLAALTLASTNTVTTPALTQANTTVGSATPAVGASTTVTLGSSLRYLGNGEVLVGGVPSGIISLSPDSAIATIVPALNATGAVSFTGIALKFLTAVPLALPSNGKTIAPTGFGGVTLAGGTDITNAPEITLPTAVGKSVVVTDNGTGYAATAVCTGTLGGDNCRFYKVVVPAGQNFNLTGRFDTSADIGFYRLNSAGGFSGTIADALGQSSSQQEAGALGSNLAAGTYYIAVTYYGPNSYGGGAVARPTIMQIRLTRTN